MQVSCDFLYVVVKDGTLIGLITFKIFYHPDIVTLKFLCKQRLNNLSLGKKFPLLHIPIL